MREWITPGSDGIRQPLGDVGVRPWLTGPAPRAPECLHPTVPAGGRGAALQEVWALRPPQPPAAGLRPVAEGHREVAERHDRMHSPPTTTTPGTWRPATAAWPSASEPPRGVQGLQEGHLSPGSRGAGRARPVVCVAPVGPGPPPGRMLVGPGQAGARLQSCRREARRYQSSGPHG